MDNNKLPVGIVAIGRRTIQVALNSPGAAVVEALADADEKPTKP